MARKRSPGRKRPAARGAPDRPERQQDPRLVAVQAEASTQGDVDVKKGDWLVVVSPVDREDGERLAWHPPQPVAFNLIEAQRHRDLGVQRRRAIMGNLKRRSDGSLGPRDTRAALDCLSSLSAAVLFSFTAIESLANHAIDMLPAETVITRKGREVAQADMVRSLGIDDKLKRAVPLLDGATSIAGTTTWERYRDLKFLRDELLHVKERGYDPDPSVRTAYDRLMLGEADGCVNDALAVVQGAFPGFLPPHVLNVLSS